MRYQAVKEGLVTEKKKKCVYCGHTFKIHTDLLRSRIVAEEEKNTTTALFHSALEKQLFLKKSTSCLDKNKNYNSLTSSLSRLDDSNQDYQDDHS